MHLLIHYVNLLHKHRSPDAKEVIAFKDEHKHDEAFVRRTDTMNKLWRATHDDEL